MYVKVKVNYLLFHLMIKYRNPWPYRVFSVSPAMNSRSPSQQDRSTELSQAHYSSFCFGFLCTCCLLFLECLLYFCKPWKCLFILQYLVLIFPTPMKTITIPQSLSSFCAFIRLYFNGLYLNASLPCYLMSSLNTGLYSILFIFVFLTQDCPLFIWVWSTLLQFYIERQKKKIMRGIPELLLVQQVNDLLLGLFPS